MTDAVAFLDGRRLQDPDLSADRLLGLTCFETMALLDGRVRFLDRHLDRFQGSWDALGLAPEGGRPGVEQRILAAVEETGLDRGIVRASLHATDTPKGLTVEAPACELLVLVTPPRHGDLAAGVEAITSTVRAPDPASWPPRVKAPCLPRYLAKREARERGAFEALMLDGRGHVVSGSHSNVLAVVEGVVVVAPAPPALPGVTRDRVLEVLRVQALEHRVSPLHRDELTECRELMVTFTGPGVVPVVSLDGAPVGEGEPGPVARRLRDALSA